MAHIAMAGRREKTAKTPVAEVIPPAAGMWFAPCHLWRSAESDERQWGACCLNGVPLLDFERPSVAHNRHGGAGVHAVQGRASPRFRLE